MTGAPLDGVRIVDLTVVWSGPGATTLLGDLGAEVIRVEDPRRTSRGVSARTADREVGGREYATRSYPERDPGKRPYDRSPIFNWHARNKLSVSMSLGTPQGHADFLRLIEKSDVFIENNTKGVLAKLGIDYDTLSAVNPRLIVVRMPALGLDGPMSDYRGYGPNFNALVGIQAMDGYADGDPTIAGENYHMDEASPAGAAFAVLAALWERERTGRGQLVEFAQAENVMHEIGEYFLDHQMNDRVPAPAGNRDPLVLQDVLPTAGPDVWVALSIRHDADWRALEGVVGAADWLSEGRTGELRTRNADRLLEHLADFTARYGVDELVDLFQSAGIPAGEVMSEARVLADPHLADREWFQTRSHPTVGTYPYPGHPWRTDGFELRWGRPVPGFGEDNAYVYKDVLGCTDAEYDQRVAQGLVSDEQIV
ncbi:CaiB/BaiF CoA transferase family protein [Streptomyces albipurpureus]|uniref:CoA transferase n=1 Tax=Streptomyces albipurpureus TaxID=2897419 RepID=A0ABT0UJI6_9ACTN|nr:CoA transferase [Streptomyces sp. CWNU-1]MCM2387578.1 CoA transferase [Streptomyces sp. CWNU-1]